MPNRLQHESSPYLLQHKDNPVDWFPWGEEAIAKAKQEDKPIFLSIGYSACHWCHVMEHESFESERIASFLNEHFVSIKIDREERPDLDQIYMQAVQMLTGRGGWPMSMFLTPDLKPFYGGTYWPPSASRAMPGFDQITSAVKETWQNRRQQALDGADEITRILQAGDAHTGGAGEPLSEAILEQAERQLGQMFDATWGGFGGAPKFPQAGGMQFLLHRWHRSGRERPLEMVCITLDRMAAGGIYDHLGGGFARYSVDERWLVPHFEKMLYDNAQLVAVMTSAYAVTNNERYAEVIKESCDYILRDMTDEADGFFSTEDADSEGEEGLFYTWTPDEIEAVLGSERATTFCRVYDVSEEGNFEGRSILNLPKTLEQMAGILQRDADELTAELTAARKELFTARENRIRPGRDEKIITAWNGMMIDALAEAAAVFALEPQRAADATRYRDAAVRAAEFLLRKVCDDDGNLLHTYKDGTAKISAFLDDYACLVNALITLYETTFDPRWIDHAVRLTDIAREKFADPEGGGYFYADPSGSDLIARPKDFTDASVPSGNGMLATVLMRIGHLTGKPEYLDGAERTIQAAAGILSRAPTAAAQLLLALDWQVGPVEQFVLVADAGDADTTRLTRQLSAKFAPRTVRAAASLPAEPAHESSHLAPLLEGRQDAATPALYICKNFTCDQPLHGTEQIEHRLSSK